MTGLESSRPAARSPEHSRRICTAKPSDGASIANFWEQLGWRADFRRTQDRGRSDSSSNTVPFHVVGWVENSRELHPGLTPTGSRWGPCPPRFRETNSLGWGRLIEKRNMA